MSSSGQGWSRRTGRRSFAMIGMLLLLIVLVLSPLMAFTTAAAPAPATAELQSSAQEAWSAPRTVYIPASGQMIDGVFLDFWRASGGPNTYGNPISSEYDRNGRIVQYYEYARFEYVPEGSDGSYVLLGDIGYDLRPSAVMRVLNGTSSEAIEEFARITRAWLPVSSDLAAQAPTDTWTYVPATGHTVANGFKNLWEYLGVSYLGNPISEEYIIGDVTYQVFERGQLAWTEEGGAVLVPLGSELADRQTAPTEPVEQGDVPVYDEALFIPPAPPGPYIDPNGGAVWFDINLSAQYMTFYQGDREVVSTYVSTGRPGFETPAGTFYINSKYESHDMEGTASGETWFVPDVPWAMYFTDYGHAIHGTYWHSNFGNVMSHGCVNLPLDVAAFVYQNSPIGTRVYVHY